MTAGSYGTARAKTKVRFFPLQRPRTEQKCRCADKAHAHHTRGHWSPSLRLTSPTHHAPCQPRKSPRSPALSGAHPPTSSASAARDRPHNRRCARATAPPPPLVRTRCSTPGQEVTIARHLVVGARHGEDAPLAKVEACLPPIQTSALARCREACRAKGACMSEASGTA